MEELNFFIEGPLLMTALGIFAIGVLCRFVFFVYTLFRKDGEPVAKRKNALIHFGRFFLPFHMGILKQPLYGSPALCVSPLSDRCSHLAFGAYPLVGGVQFRLELVRTAGCLCGLDDLGRPGAGGLLYCQAGRPEGDS